MKDYPLDTITKGHTDIPKMRKGKVGAMLMNVFGGDSVAYIKAWDLLYRMESMYKNDLKIVTSSKEMRLAMKEGKIGFLPILEGAKRLQDDPALLRVYYKLGLRSVTFAYSTNGLADGSDDNSKQKGISELGKVMMRENNRLTDIFEIINFTVIHNPVTPILVRHRLVPGRREINNRETAVP